MISDNYFCIIKFDLANFLKTKLNNNVNTECITFCKIKTFKSKMLNFKL